MSNLPVNTPGHTQELHPAARTAPANGSVSAATASSAEADRLGPLIGAAAWGELTSDLAMGLTHNVRNLLAGIYMTADQVEGAAGPSHPASAALGLLKQNGIRINNVLNALLELRTASSKPEPMLTDANQAVTAVVDLLPLFVPGKPVVETLLCTTGIPVLVNPLQLKQAIMAMVYLAHKGVPAVHKIRLESARGSESEPGGVVLGVMPSLPAAVIRLRGPCRDLAAARSSAVSPREGACVEDVGAGEAARLNAALLYFSARLGGAVTLRPAEDGTVLYSLWLPEASLC